MIPKTVGFQKFSVKMRVWSSMNAKTYKLAQKLCMDCKYNQQSKYCDFGAAESLFGGRVIVNKEE